MAEHTPGESRSRGGLSRVLVQTWLLFKKDLITELRTRETLVMLLFFSLLMVVIFTFSFFSDEETARAVAPGVLWITVAFTGTLGIDRSFAREQEGRTLTALVLVPGAPRALFAAKTLTNVLMMALVEIFVTPVALGVLGVPVSLREVPMIAATLIMGTVGFAAVGTVFSAMLVAVRRRGVLLPIILYPVTIPLLVMGVKALEALVNNRPYAEFTSWARLMVVVDVLYVVAGAWLFGAVLDDE